MLVFENSHVMVIYCAYHEFQDFDMPAVQQADNEGSLIDILIPISDIPFSFHYDFIVDNELK